MSSAPKKERAGQSALKTAQLPAAYRVLSLLQVAVLESVGVYAPGWEKSGDVLLREFCRAGRVKFLLAFVRHLLAILGREPEAGA